MSVAPFKWDHTKWSTYDQCPLKYLGQWIERWPQGPVSPALLKGRRGHTAVENIIKAGVPDVYGVHPKAMRAVAHVIAQEDKIIEHKITLNRDWEMVPNKSSFVWLTVKMDVAYKATPPDDKTQLHVIDWKTGKTRALEYFEQLDLYRLVAAIAWPADKYLASIVNLDDGGIVDEEKTRAESLASRDKWTERATAMETETRFEPKPNKYCDWCPFANSKGGRCRYG